jgi:hypothetical protein
MDELGPLQPFYVLYEEIDGDWSKLSDTEASRALYGSYEALQLVIQLRDLYRRKHFRGVTERGKVTYVQFKSDLSAKEDEYLEKNLEKLNALYSHV